MGLSPELLEIRLLEDMAREEIEFWEFYICRCFAHAGEPFPVRALQALAQAEEKLALCLEAIHDGNAGMLKH
jgi:hypothetical protein